MIHEIVVLWLSHYLNNIIIKYNMYIISAWELQPESYVAKPRPFVFQVEDSFIFLTIYTIIIYSSYLWYTV